MLCFGEDHDFDLEPWMENPAHGIGLAANVNYGLTTKKSLVMGWAEVGRIMLLLKALSSSWGSPNLSSVSGKL